MYAWIPKGKALAKKVVFDCYKCKLDRKSLMEQQMANLPSYVTCPSPPWLYLTLDYAGPFSCYDEVKRRVSRKVWLVIFVCLTTKAVEVLPCPGYDTDSFIKVIQRFFFSHGRPKLVRSDLGSAIQAGQKLITDEVVNAVFDVFQRTEWQFITAKSPWRVGAAEAMVKGTKKCISKIFQQGTKMTYSELELLCSAVSYTLNQRPIGVKNAGDAENELQYISPSQLLLGRCDSDGQNPAFIISSDLPERAAYVKSVYSAWWSAWNRMVFPLLVPCRKWQDAKKNLAVGDICLLNFPNMKHDCYKLCRVLEVVFDGKGRVRTARVQYRRGDQRDKPEEYQEGRQFQEWVPVQRLCLLFSTAVPNDEVLAPNDDSTGSSMVAADSTKNKIN